MYKWESEQLDDKTSEFNHVWMCGWVKDWTSSRVHVNWFIIEWEDEWKSESWMPSKCSSWIICDCVDEWKSERVNGWIRERLQISLRCGMCLVTNSLFYIHKWDPLQDHWTKTIQICWWHAVGGQPDRRAHPVHFQAVCQHHGPVVQGELTATKHQQDQRTVLP